MPFISSVRRAFGPQGRKNTPYRLYAFSSHTFTAAGAGGRNGPTLANCQSAYASTSWKNDSNAFGMDIQGIQRWKVPQTGRYRIVTVGAPGGRACDNTAGWGSGTSMQGDFNLTAGTWLNILVGQRGINDPAYANYGSGTRMSAGGGGGSGVWLDSAIEPLVMSGGGAGSSDQPESFDGRHTYTKATTSTTANRAWNDSSFVGGTSAGFGGTTPCSNSNNNAAPGGGFKSAGQNCGAGGGARLQTDGTGGTANSGDGNRNNNAGQNMHGGFGGGGGPGGWYGCSGGGGGYSGGSSGSDNDGRAAGGGGGSYNAGTNQVNSVLGNGQTGHGSVTITRL
jgi:hypothetical protein